MQVQLEFEDVTFSVKTAPDDMVATADSATLKLDNQKNGWKNLCINQEANRDHTHYPVWVLG